MRSPLRLLPPVHGFPPPRSPHPIPGLGSADDVAATLHEATPQDLVPVVLAIALVAPDLEWAEEVCLLLSRHPDAELRAYAILGLGHLAGRCAPLDRHHVVDRLRAARHDADPCVRGFAELASEDLWREAHRFDPTTPRPA